MACLSAVRAQRLSDLGAESSPTADRGKIQLQWTHTVQQQRQDLNLM